ncbi:MAG TPA: hypothetical protein VIF36_04890 [Gaiellaceae bacterium]|jgi:hypothetical protein
MAWLRKSADLGARIALVAGIPLGALILTARVFSRLDNSLPGRIQLILGPILAFILLAATCNGTKKLTRLAPCPRWIPILYAALIALVVPMAATGYRHLTDENDILTAERSPGALDVLVVQPPQVRLAETGSSRDLLAAPVDALRWNVRFSIASTASGWDALKLNLINGTRRAAIETLGGRAPSRAQALLGSLLTWAGWRPDSARAVVLNVDGIDDRGLLQENTRSRPSDWAGLIGRNTPPVYAILGEASPARLLAWQKWTKRRRGEAILFRDAGRLLFVDAALRVATERRADFEHEALAWRYRPKIFFDSLETFPNPLDVESFLSSGKVSGCRKARWSDVCESIDGKGPPNPELAYFYFDPADFQGDTFASSIYYHAVRHGANELHLDYWWFFPYNPTAVERDAACGPGLAIADVTCFDHASDWEGLTVVLRRSGNTFLPSHVIYAQHEFGVAFGWEELRERWRAATLLDGARPIVFVARDSHASYPVPCEEGCKQIHRGTVRKEGRHDGLHSWSRNGIEACKRTCLKRLPQTRDGRAALWNASPRPWGKSNCVLWGTYCDVGEAPRAPRFQGRFMRPWLPLQGRQRAVDLFHVHYSSYD